MKISQRKLRMLIREVIEEALSPETQASLATLKDQLDKENKEDIEAVVDTLAPQDGA
jgi:hypothetical protein